MIRLATERICKCCKKVKPLSEFSELASRKTGYKGKCKSCEKGLFDGMAISFKDLDTFTAPMGYANAYLPQSEQKWEGYPILLHMALRAGGWNNQRIANRLNLPKNRIKAAVVSMGLTVKGRRLYASGEHHSLYSHEKEMREAQHKAWTTEKREVAAANRRTSWSQHPEAKSREWQVRYEQLKSNPERWARLLKNKERRRRRLGMADRSDYTKRLIGMGTSIQEQRKIKDRIRGNTVAIYKTGATVHHKWLGCTGAQLREWLEMQFKKGMNHENFGTNWSIDHIVPLASFDLSKAKQYAIAANFCNLQPLTIKQNSKKGSETDGQLHLMLSQ